ncbi:MAG: hypothetical protein GWP08_18120 [Nitrospiraceae bacterium]|nr:hypothetical protein [Nitrospiraceae bacterium]
MDTHKVRLLVGTLSVALCCMLGVASTAENFSNADLWGIDADVDRDGLISATDVQHVINRALGLDDDTGNVQRRLRQFVVASPRASLSVLPPCANSFDCLRSIGATYNFPRDDARMAVRPGTVIVFRLGRDLEGVWYEDASGFLSTQLVVDMRVWNDTVETPWVAIGKDGASGDAIGPMVGRAEVGVRHAFREPGEYLVRARIWTHAIPNNDLDCVPEEPATKQDEDPDVEAPCGSARSYDEVYILVRVAAVEPTPADVAWQKIPEPVMQRFGERLSQRLHDCQELDAEVEGVVEP